MYLCLSPFNKLIVKSLRDFLRNIQKENKGIFDEVVVQVSTHQEWMNLKVNPPKYDATAIPINAARPYQPHPNSFGMDIDQEYAAFIKGIKRDADKFQETNDKKNFHLWYQAFMDVARAQRLDEVLIQLSFLTETKRLDSFTKSKNVRLLYCKLLSRLVWEKL